jgi:hypothetical protein
MLATAAMVLMVAGVYAQGKDFSGKWTPDAEKNAAANAGGGGGGRGGGRGGGGGDMTVTQDAKTLKITRTGPNGDTVTTYNLDGSPSKNTGRGGEVESTAKWDGAKLVITTKNPNGDQVTSWYMEGSNLVNERQGQNGAMKTYYKKAS